MSRAYQLPSHGGGSVVFVHAIIRAHPCLPSTPNSALGPRGEFDAPANMSTRRSLIA
jgi:hypothetical protein